MHNELYGCLNQSIVTSLSDPTFVIDAKVSPTSSMYMPSSIGSVKWNVNGIEQQVNWTSFGSTPEVAIKNAKSFQQIKQTSVEEICRSIIQQTIQVKGK